MSEVYNVKKRVIKAYKQTNDSYLLAFSPGYFLDYEISAEDYEKDLIGKKHSEIKGFNNIDKTVFEQRINSHINSITLYREQLNSDLIAICNSKSRLIFHEI